MKYDPRISNGPNHLGLCALQDVKSKIFCVFCKCGFDGHGYLSAEELTRLTFVRKYVELKQGEIMEDIATELDAALVRPISPDAERMSQHLAANQVCIDSVFDDQQAVRDAVLDVEAADEATFMVRFSIASRPFLPQGDAPARFCSHSAC